MWLTYVNHHMRGQHESGRVNQAIKKKLCDGRQHSIALVRIRYVSQEQFKGHQEYMGLSASGCRDKKSLEKAPFLLPNISVRSRKKCIAGRSD
jgi:hypothetical protein